MRTNLKRHDRVHMLSSKHTYRPMSARVAAQLFHKMIAIEYNATYLGLYRQPVSLLVLTFLFWVNNNNDDDKIALLLRGR